VQLVDSPGREPVAARLLTGERLAFDDRDVMSTLREPVAGGRAGRAAADDENVGVEFVVERRRG